MSAVLDDPAAPPSTPRRGRTDGRPGGSRGSWVRSVRAGAALLLAGAPVGAVVQGDAWALHAAGIVALVVAVGIVAGAAARRGTDGVAAPGVGAAGVGAAGVGAAGVGAAGVGAAQLVALALALTGRFSEAGVARVLPGPAAVTDLSRLVGEAAAQIRTGVAPVPATPAMLLLITGAFGLTAVAVHSIAVQAHAPAVAGVLLLAVFAVPTALADDLLPGWMLASAAAGLGLLLLSGPAADRTAGSVRRAPVAAALTATAVVLALGVGAAAGGVGTAGRFAGPGAGSGPRGGQIGLTPFTALRGQLEQGTPKDLFRVSGLPRPTYLRALTLSTYVPDSGWRPSSPGPGTALPGRVPVTDVPGDRARVTVDNLAFRDYWLPLFGVPVEVAGVTGDRWAYDPISGTAYSTRPRGEESWTQDALLPAPSAALLRSADGTSGVAKEFLDTTGIDPRVARLAADVTAGAPTGFDRAVALTEWFTGPDSAFRYDLSTAPGNGDDAMVDFLTRGRRGYCEQFASSMAAMLRTLGVPARVAVGFTGGREVGGGRAVGTTDAHAWVEAWFAGAGWTTFDPTPLSDGRALVPPYVAEALAGSGVGADGAAPGGDQAAPADPTTGPTSDPSTPNAADEPTPQPAADDPAADDPAANDPARSDPTAPTVLRGLVGLLTVGAAALVVGAPALWRARLRRRRLDAAAAGGPGAADAAWAELLAESADRGVTGRAADTVRGAARRLVEEHGLGGGAAQAVRSVVGIVEESWYGGVDPAPGDLTAPLATVLAAIRAGTPLRPRGRLLPRSVVDAVDERRDRRRGPAADDALTDDARTDDAAAARH